MLYTQFLASKLSHSYLSDKPTPPPLAANPFSDQQQPDPLLLIPKPTINEMKQAPFVVPPTQFIPPSAAPATYTPTPLAFAGPAPTPLMGNPSTFTSTTNGGLFAAAPQPLVHDPWTPVVTTTTSGNNAWVKQEQQANPFLS